MWAERRPERASKLEISTQNQRNTDCQRSKNRSREQRTDSRLVFQRPARHFSINQERLFDSDPGLIVVYLIFAAGLILPIFHAFSSARKTLIEKKLMLMFAVLTNAFAGVWSATYMLSHAHGWMMIFPAWNIINSIILYTFLREGTIDESSISDDNVDLYELTIGGTIAAVAFLVCDKGLELNWALTLSICLAYATNLNVPVVVLLFRLFNKNRESRC